MPSEYISLDNDILIDQDLNQPILKDDIAIYYLFS